MLRITAAGVQSLLKSNRAALTEVFKEYAHDPTLRRPVLGLGAFCVLCNAIGLSPPISKPDLARTFRAVNAGAVADGREEALDYREFEECLFRLCRQ